MDPHSSHRYPTEPRPQDPRNDPRGTSLETLMHYLRGLDYPAPRNKLVAKALENGAPVEVTEKIAGLPETADFLSEDEVWRAYGGE